MALNTDLRTAIIVIVPIIIIGLILYFTKSKDSSVNTNGAIYNNNNLTDVSVPPTESNNTDGSVNL